MWHNLDLNSALSSKFIVIMITLSCFAVGCVVDYITQAKGLVKIRHNKYKTLYMKIWSHNWEKEVEWKVGNYKITYEFIVNMNSTTNIFQFFFLFFAKNHSWPHWRFWRISSSKSIFKKQCVREMNRQNSGAVKILCMIL